MKIHAHSVYRERDPESAGFFQEVRRLAQLDAVGQHTLVSDPEEADVVLVTEAQSHLDDWRFSAILASPFVQRWCEKALVYCDADRPVCVLPGLYPSVPRAWQDVSQQLSFPYLGISSFGSALPAQDGERDLLFSFSGQLQSHPCRVPIATLHHARMELVDTSGQYFFALAPEQQAFVRARYRRQLPRSQFVLCPRGGGASSYRLFEALAAGCVPVIISDAWVEPPGPEWAAFAVRVPENNVRMIPAMLAERERDVPAMRVKLREAYKRYFADEALFNYLGDCLEHLTASRLRTSFASAARRWRAYGTVGALHLRRAARTRLKTVVYRALSRQPEALATQPLP